MSETNQGVMPRKRSRIRRSKSAEGNIGRAISRGAGGLGHAPRDLTPASDSKPATLGIIKKSDVRFGVKEGGRVFFTKEERFAWQNAHKTFDVVYDIPDPKTPPFSFGTSTRDDWKKIFQNTRDLHNPQAGPGNYNTDSGLNFLSEFPSRRDITFGIASRESAGLTTASPGVLYKIDGMFKNGTTKGKILPRFNVDTRKPLADNIKSTTSAVYWPQLSRKGGAVWFGSREQDRFQGEVDKISRRSPGPIYDVAKYGIPTGPKFSFGASRRDRWGNLREPTIS